jgi:hypothetical protein
MIPKPETLLDNAYNIARPYRRSEPVYEFGLPKLEEACPGYTAEQYRDAYDKALDLIELTADLSYEWYLHHIAEFEAMDKIYQQCPGFSEFTYGIAWHTAVFLNR